MKQLHDNGYQFVGDTSLYKLTVSEVRVMLEGAAAQNDEKAKQNGSSNGSGPHERAPGKARQSDEDWVEELANSE